MKKVVTLVLILLSIVSLCITLCACDNNKNDCITITVIVRESGQISQESYSIVKPKGSCVSLDDFDKFIHPEQEISFGYSAYAGLYIDEECIFKHDEDCQINNDITLYIRHNGGVVPTINFVLDGKTYSMIAPNEKSITAFDFIATAYGKSAIPEEFDFFVDENCTVPLELIGENYKTCYRNIFNAYTIYVKKTEVNHFCFKYTMNGTHINSFNALLRVDTVLDEDFVKEYVNLPADFEVVYSVDDNGTTVLTSLLDATTSQTPYTVFVSIQTL